MTRRLGCVISLVGVVALLVFLSRFRGPGEGTFNVQLVNDTSEEVVLQGPCTTEVPKCDYRVFPGSDLNPGASVRLGTSIYHGDIVGPFRAVDTSGHVLGCVPLLFDRVQDGLTVKFSEQLVPCV
jgi:hypothetical protein